MEGGAGCSQPTRAPASLAAARMAGNSWSVRPGTTGATSTRTGTPTEVSDRMARSRALGAEARGSIARARAGSSVVTLMLTWTSPCDAIRPRMSTSRMTWAFLVMMLMGWLTAAATSRHRRMMRKSRLAGLIRIGYAGNRDRLWLPFVASQERAEKLGSIVLDDDVGLEAEPGIVAKILMCRPSIAIGTSMLATAIGIQTIPEADIGAVVLADHRSRPIGNEARGRMSQRFNVVGIEINHVEGQNLRGLLETGWWPDIGATTDRDGRMAVHVDTLP